MNLFKITKAMVSAVNPMVSCSIKFNQGTTKNADFSLAPAYSAPVTLMGQIQALQYKDIMQVDGLNLQGTRRAIYLEGDVEALVRVSQQGGDVITMPDGSVWLTALVLENWNPPDGSKSGWVKVAVTLQNGS